MPYFPPSGSGGAGIIPTAIIPLFDFGTVLYVATTGSDITGDGTVGNPWKTIQFACDYACRHYWINQNAAVEISLADGTYNEEVYLNSVFGGGYIWIHGNTGNKRAVVWNGNNSCVYGYGAGLWVISWLKFTATSGSTGLVSQYGNNNQILVGNVVYGTSPGGPHNITNSGGNSGKLIIQDAEIDGTASYFVDADTDGYVEISHGTITINVGGGWVTSLYRVSRHARIYDATNHDLTWVNTAAWAGTKYVVQASGTLFSLDVAGIPGTGGTCDPGGRVLDGSIPAIIAPAFIGDTGAGGKIGYVPAPGAGDAAAGKFLKANATWSVPPGGVIVDTIKNILALTPTSGLTAYATDIFQTLVANGTTWLLDSSYSTAVALPDVGWVPYSNRLGYGSDYVTDKRLANCFFGTSGLAEEGGMRHNDTLGVLQVYLQGAWRTLTSGVSIRENNNILEHRPLTMWIMAYSGNSEDVGLNGRPIIQNYEVSLGAYPPEPVIDGGTF